MKYFINLSTRAKLLFGFGSMWLVMAIVILITNLEIHSITNSEKSLHERQFTQELNMTKIRSELNRLRAITLQLLYHVNDAKSNEMVAEIATRQSTIDQLIQSVLDSSNDPATTARIKEFKSIFADYCRNKDIQLEYFRTGRTVDAERLTMGDQVVRYDSLRFITVTLSSEAEQSELKQLASDLAASDRSSMMMILLGVLAFVVGGSMIVVLNRTIAIPLTRMSETALSISSRDDLSIAFDTDARRDEVGTLARAFQRMVENLRSSTTDIRESRRLEQEMRSASLYARNLIEASLDPLVTISSDGKITDVNRTAEEATGATREQLIGSDFADYFTEPEKARAGYKQVFSLGQVRDYPLTIRHASGRTMDVIYNASVYRDEEGHVQGVFAAARDVTEARRLEKQVKDQRDSLEKKTADLSNVLDKVKETVAVLSASSSEILAATTQIASTAAEVAAGIGETSTTVEQVRQAAQLSSQKAGRVSESAQRVNEASQAGQAAVDETTKGMQVIQVQMGSIAQTIMRLSEQSQLIGGIIASVGEIADQSNLLAVNAAIEAARAEEHGKGFTVVAQEIKTLAEQSKQATAKVRDILLEVQKATNAAVMVTEQGGKAVEAGTKQAVQTGESIRILSDYSSEALKATSQIVASSQQQVTGMDQIGIAMMNINQASTENAASMIQAERAAKELYEMGQKLKMLIDQYHS